MSEPAMSNSATDFMTLALNGYVLPDEIDDFVEAWHDGENEGELHDFLGMTLEEFTLWVSDADSISIIISARHRRIPLVTAVNDNLAEVERIAARTDKSWKIAQLRAWIQQQRGG